VAAVEVGGHQSVDGHERGGWGFWLTVVRKRGRRDGEGKRQRRERVRDKNADFLCVGTT